MFLEGSEIMFDGAEVWGVRWQEQQSGTGLLNKLGGFWRFVKGGIVDDHEVLGREARAQPRLQPGVEDPRIAGPFEPQGFFEPSLDARGQQRGPRPSMSRDQTIHALALRGIPIPSGGRRRKATFINMDELFTAVAEALTKAEKPSALPRVTFLIAHLFMGHLQALEDMPNTMPGDLEMSGPVRLGLIRMDVHMTAQRVPIQFARPLWAGTLVRDPAGLEPPIDAGLTDLESPSRFGLAATTTHKIHHPLTQIC